MRALQGFTLLLIAQVAGELLARGLGLPLPGPVLGLMLMLLALPLPAVQQRVEAAADVLLAHLSLLFVPIGVGVVSHLGVLGAHAWSLLLVLLVSTALGLAVTALVLQGLWVDEPAEGKTP
ncbi:MAG: CidA/LrgA family protein [Rubrivivax sp.]